MAGRQATRRVALAAAAALLGAGVVSSPGARAAAPADFVGIQWYEVPSVRDFDRMRRARIPVYRQDVVWRLVEPTRSRYVWRRYDSLFDRAAARGVRVMPVLVGSPAWVSSNIHYPPRTDAHRRAYYRFVAAVAARYGPSGTFWRSRPAAWSRFAARQLQIWNEPNLPNWWNGRPDPAQYAVFLKGAAAAARRAKPGIEIVSAGIPESRNRNVMTISSFIRGMYRVPGVKGAFDHFGSHPYARTPGLVLDYVERTRSELRRAGDGAKPIWVTEFGWSTSAAHSDFGGSNTRQALYLEQAYRAFIARRRVLGLRGAVWYSLRDAPSGDRWVDGWQLNAGLFTVHDRAKPAWGSMLEVTGAR